MIFLLVGAPGAGKGTQADMLVNDLGAKKISTGDALRKHISANTDVGLKVASFVSTGRLVPDEILFSVLKEELSTTSEKIVLLDGYPRNSKQAETLDSLENVKISGVVYIDVEDEVLISRLLGRQVCLSCGAIYHKLNSPSKISGKCDKCDGDLVTRSDDEQEKIKTRLEIFGKETTPVLSHYKNKGIYFRVDGNCSPEKVYEQVKAIIQSKI